MKVIIAGSRSLTAVAAIDETEAAIAASGFTITEVVSGGARGPDDIGECWANERGIPLTRFVPEYQGINDRYAPLRRNQNMVDYADALIAVWDGASRGTADVIRRAQRKGLHVYVHRAALAGKEVDA